MDSALGGIVGGVIVFIVDGALEVGGWVCRCRFHTYGRVRFMVVGALELGASGRYLILRHIPCLMCVGGRDI